MVAGLRIGSRPYREYAILDKGVGSVPDFDGPVPDTRDPLLPLLGLLSLFGRARCVPCAPQGGVTGCREAVITGAGRCGPGDKECRWLRHDTLPMPAAAWHRP